MAMQKGCAGAVYGKGKGAGKDIYGKGCTDA